MINGRISSGPFVAFVSLGLGFKFLLAIHYFEFRQVCVSFLHHQYHQIRRMKRRSFSISYVGYLLLSLWELFSSFVIKLICRILGVPFLISNRSIISIKSI